MERLNGYRRRLVLVGFTAAIVLCGGSVKADFIFGDATKLDSPMSMDSYNEVGPHVSSDGLSFYFGSNRPGGYGRGDIWVATRPSVRDPWEEPTNLGPIVNTEYGDNHPEISADGLSLYFMSDRPGGQGNRDIWVTARPTKDDDWGTPVNLGPPVNSPAHEISPSISSDGLELYFSEYLPDFVRPGGYGWSDIWVARRPTKDDPWGEPVNLGPLVNSPTQDTRPHISLDGLVLFFDSQRDGRPPYGELYMTRRRTLSDPWGIPVNVGLAVNTPDFEECPSVSPDGKTLFFDRSIVYTFGSHDIWQAPIIPIVDFNGDGIVDAADMCTIVDHWGEDYSFCDMGPFPWGDGVVDVEDVKVLAEHLFKDIEDPTLIAHWPLDETEGMVVADRVGDNVGYAVGEPLWQPHGGHDDGALQFDGMNDLISTPAVLDSTDDPFSVLLWIRDGGKGQAIISETGGSNWLSIDSQTGCLMTELTQAGRFGGPLLSDAVIANGSWHRIGFVWDGSNRRLYVDGVEVAQDQQAGLSSTGNGLYIGTGKNMESGTFFSGLIDDVRIYKRVVSP